MASPAETTDVAERFGAVPFDVQRLETGMALYNAPYRWARDARAEGHKNSAGAHP